MNLKSFFALLLLASVCRGVDLPPRSSQANEGSYELPPIKLYDSTIRANITCGEGRGVINIGASSEREMALKKTMYAHKCGLDISKLLDSLFDSKAERAFRLLIEKCYERQTDQLKESCIMDVDKLYSSNKGQPISGRARDLVGNMCSYSFLNEHCSGSIVMEYGCSGDCMKTWMARCRANCGQDYFNILMSEKESGISGDEFLKMIKDYCQTSKGPNGELCTRELLAGLSGKSSLLVYSSSCKDDNVSSECQQLEQVVVASATKTLERVTKKASCKTR